MRPPILPGATLGVVGGGQLGRMFTLAARRMGYRVLVLSPDADGPAAQVADGVVQGQLDDPEAVCRLAREAEVLTLEFENVDVPALAAADGLALLRPDLRLLEVARDRRLEKRTFEALGLPVPSFAVVETDSDLEPARRAVGAPSVLKTALSGYDGKGQVRVQTPAELPAAWESLDRQACVLEAYVPFAAEISVVGARGSNGDIALFEPCRNTHVHHILDVSVAPAGLPPRVVAQAEEITRTLLEGLDVVGVLCVELFLLADGSLLVNEVAPRPHNSGHLTIEGHACSQFEQQVRAACGLPLGSCERVVGGVAMTNLLGELWEAGPPRWDQALEVPGARLHLYGKHTPQPGRKMGHLTAVGTSAAEAVERASLARELLQEERGLRRESRTKGQRDAGACGVALA